MNKINIIDCTLRDGGYYNNWDFSKDLVNQYLKSVSEADIKYVELGFRSLSQKGTFDKNKVHIIFSMWSLTNLGSSVAEWSKALIFV